MSVYLHWSSSFHTVYRVQSTTNKWNYTARLCSPDTKRHTHTKHEASPHSKCSRIITQPHKHIHVSHSAVDGGWSGVAAQLLTYVVCIQVLLMVSIPACHVSDRGSIPRRGDFFFLRLIFVFVFRYTHIWMHLPLNF